MLELRILSGLHRGATLPLDDEPVVIGMDEDADVVLLDPGIESNHASLRQTSEGWALSSLDGDVLASDTNERRQSLDIAPGEFARIGPVWVAVADSGAPWVDPPAVPVDFMPEDLHGDNDSDETGEEDDTAISASAADEEPAVDAAPAENAESGEGTGGDIPADAGSRSRRKSALLLPAIICIIALTAGVAYQLVGDGSGHSPLKRGVASSGGADLAANRSPELTPAELRAAFRKRLAEVDLLKTFDLKLGDNAWTMQAALDDEEAARFERTLAAFVKQHKITFPITAKVGNAEHMLPFKIRQVVSGANASVITLDGNRLYVGDEYMGIRLVAIKDSRLTFMGKRKIDVRW